MSSRDRTPDSGGDAAEEQVIVDSDEPVLRRRAAIEADELDDDLDEVPVRRSGRRRRRTRNRASSDRMMDESASLTEAMTVGYLSQVEMFADIVGSFAESVLDRVETRNGRAGRNGSTQARARRTQRAPRSRRVAENGRPRGRRRRGGLADDLRELPLDVYDGLVDAFEDAMEVPRRSVDDFYDSYDRTGTRVRR